jgi:hypothetical protein
MGLCILQILKCQNSKCFHYININDKRPSISDSNYIIKQLGYWLSHQNKNYNIEINKSKEIIKNEKMHKEFTNFINESKYKIYFKNNVFFFK